MAKSYQDFLRDMAKTVASEASISSRPGSYDRLKDVAEALELLAERFDNFERWEAA